MADEERSLMVDEERSEWSSLPPELLHLISGKVVDVADYIRLRAVSTTWRSAVMAINQAHHRLPPCLLLPYKLDTGVCTLLNLASDRVHMLYLPEARGKSNCGSSYGWFVLLDTNTESVSLLNPVTKSQIHLPPATLFPGIVGLRDTRSSRLLGYHQVGLVYIWSASLSSNPEDHDHDCCIVIARFAIGPKFAYCRVGSDEWTVLDTTLPFRLAAVAYHGGRFYAVDIEGNCSICDAGKASLVPSMKVPTSCLENCHMVRSPGGRGELLLVSYRFTGGGRDARGNIYSDVFKLDQGEGGGRLLTWSKVTSIGDNALFFSATHCSCVPARPGIAQCMANCIYFLAPRRGHVMGRPLLHPGLYVNCSHWKASYEIIRYEIHRDMEAEKMPTSKSQPWPGSMLPCWI